MSRLLITSAIQQSSLKQNLLSCWTLDETSGTTFYDSFGSYNLTGANVTANATGKINKAADFSGTGSYLTLPSAYKFTGAYGFSMWFNADTWTAAYPGLFGGVSFGVASSMGGIALSYFKTAGVNQGLWLDIYSSTVRYAARSNLTVTTGAWHHITGGYDGVSKLYYYLDGVKSTTINTPIGVITTNWTNSSSFYLGRTQQPVGTWNSFDGKIDQAAFWSRMLSDTEMLELYNSGNGLPYINW